MAELADAYGSGPYESNFMQVQVLLPAPKKAPYSSGVLFCLAVLADLNLKKGIFVNSWGK